MSVAVAPDRPADPASMTAVVSKRCIILDITRLVRRMRHPSPSGIDRVELAYARALLAANDRPVGFEAWVPGYGFVACAPMGVKRLLSTLQASWETGERLSLASVTRSLFDFRTIRIHDPDCLHLIVSHQHLADLPRRIRRGRNARTCVYIHDTIPSDFPEYARPGGAAMHDRRMRHGTALADAVIVNSGATARSLERFMPTMGRRPALLVAPLGVERRFRDGLATADPDPRHPYFLCIGTIEPRKNHLLLLHAWRALADSISPADMPRLVLVGRRGWENENVVDLLDRSTVLRNVVLEEGGVGDARLALLLAHARAVLMPSFAEGFGLPVAEALAARVPVIASDLPVLRETGGVVPDFLDPLDGPAWIRAIRDYTHPQSAMRAAQMRRMAGWKAPGWTAHFERVLPFLDGL